jgi:hypothetical protein
MGRVSRHKRIKAVDPFSKTSLANRGPGGGITDAKGDGFVLDAVAESAAPGKNGPQRNLAPKKTEPNNIPRKLRELMALKAKAEGKATGPVASTLVKEKKEAKPHLVVSHGHGALPRQASTRHSSSLNVFVLVFFFPQKMEPLPGESMFSFKKRVRRELKKRLQEIKSAKPISTVKTVSDSRREYLQARADAKKRRKLGLPADAPLPEKSGSSSSADSDDDDEAGKHKPSTTTAAVAGVKRGRPVDDDGGDDDAVGPAAKRPKKQQGKERDENRPDEFPTADSTLAFGDRAERPPEIKAQPRKSKKQREAEALHKMRQWAATKAEQIAASGAADDTEAGRKALEHAETFAAKAEKAEQDHAAKMRQEALKKAQMEKLRGEAMAAYANLKKKRREEEQSIYKASGGGSSFSSSHKGKSSAGYPSSSSSSSSSAAPPMGALRAGTAITAGFKPPQAS